ncbi:MAG: hypothetical protein ACYC2K_11305 [Gemmatimonadales bacterium]
MANPDIVIPVFGMITGILTTGALAWGMVRVFQGPVGQAMARRIQGRGGAGADPEVLNELDDLRHQLDQVQGRLTEAEERLDFSERLLSQRSSADQGRA